MISDADLGKHLYLLYLLAFIHLSPPPVTSDR
jgi:hypothetical protein